MSNENNVNNLNFLGDIQKDEKHSYSKVVQKGKMNKKVMYEVNSNEYINAIHLEISINHLDIKNQKLIC